MKGNKPLRIPLPGGSGSAKTGAIQFEHDWPGLFIRGDEAIGMMVSIRELQSRLATNTDPAVFHALFVLGRIADVVDREVKQS